MLNSWSNHNRTRIEQMVSDFSHTGDYAVFDADGTLWENDLSESLLAFLEAEGIITVKRLHQSMFPIPISGDESLIRYYQRLCDINISLGYFWLCQSFSGFSIRQLSIYIDRLLADREERTHTKQLKNDFMKKKNKKIPLIFHWQQELIAYLKSVGIAVYVVTASLEDLVRLMVSTPRYGFSIPPENVIGMKLALNSPNGTLLDQTEKKMNEKYFNSVVTPSLAGITPWYAGKVAAIKTYIDPVKQPVLVAGDSDSDIEMLNYAKPACGLKLFIKQNTPHII